MINFNQIFFKKSNFLTKYEILLKIRFFSKNLILDKIQCFRNDILATASKSALLDVMSVQELKKKIQSITI